jgi:hypothetical protein
VRGVQKHHKKISKNKSNPGPFLALTHLLTHGGPRFFFLGGPLVRGAEEKEEENDAPPYFYFRDFRHFPVLFVLNILWCFELLILMQRNGQKRD